MCDSWKAVAGTVDTVERTMEEDVERSLKDNLTRYGVQDGVAETFVSVGYPPLAAAADHSWNSKSAE